jgi:hypothetical protein
LRSFRTKIDDRHQVFLVLSAEIERQLREAYDLRFRQGLANQSSLATKLDVDRSVIHRRLTGRTNMTTETLADMVWALNHCIHVHIYDPETSPLNHHPGYPKPQPVESPNKPVINPLQSPDPHEFRLTVG